MFNERADFDFRLGIIQLKGAGWRGLLALAITGAVFVIIVKEAPPPAAITGHAPSQITPHRVGVGVPLR